jgi:hypothetical protein
MTELGHNNPPAFDAFSLALDDLRIEAGNFLDGAPIETQGQADAVGTILARARQIRKDADAARKIEKQPHDEAAKAVQTKWLPLLDKADSIMTAAQRPITTFLAKQLAEQIAAAEEARLEAAVKQQEAIAAQRASDGDVEAVERAKELQREADAATKLASKASRAKAQVAGEGRALGLRTYKIAVVADRRALLEWVMRNDPVTLAEWLAEYAQKKLPSVLPGVTVNEEKRVA